MVVHTVKDVGRALIEFAPCLYLFIQPNRLRFCGRKTMSTNGKDNETSSGAAHGAVVVAHKTVREERSVSKGRRARRVKASHGMAYFRWWVVEGGKLWYLRYAVRAWHDM